MSTEEICEYWGTYKSVELDVKMILARSILVDSLGSVEDKVSGATTNIVSHRQWNLVETGLAGLAGCIQITKQDLAKTCDSVQDEAEKTLTHCRSSGYDQR